ncbi:uncharacterized protein JCM6883_006847 [Sporobolomyces salmoneus]|uniref:uncharacterized protein n=1 Tax=Sporobolomyces salmoneus TaxID=183962 RepID=UPI0031730947
MESTEQGASVFILSPRAAPSAVGRIADANSVPSSPPSPTALSRMTLNAPANEMAAVSAPDSTTIVVDSPATAPALLLPPELLLKIFRKAVFKPPFKPGYGEYRARRINLLSLALVNSAWTEAAQELLHEVIYIGGIYDDMIREKAEQFRNGKPIFSTKWLFAGRKSNLVTDITGFERWSEVKTLEAGAMSPVTSSWFASFIPHSTTTTLDSPATVNIFSLPPELILEVFERAVAKPPFPMKGSEYQDRLDTLSALALVHSSWTGVAQELLHEAIAIGRWGFRDDEKEAKRLGTKTSKHAETKWLSITGHSERVIEITGVERWTGVRYLEIVNCGPSASEYLTLQFFASFPRVETLKLSSDSDVKDFEPGLSFAHLRRLVLGEYNVSTIYGDISTCRTVFSPACMPNLTHLALAVSHSDVRWFIPDVFSLLLPQLTTLALCDSSGMNRVPLLLPTPDILRNLSHLSLNLSNFRKSSELVSSLVSALKGGLKLESLHLVYLWGLEEELHTLLLTIANKNQEERQISRIVLYGVEGGRQEVKQVSDLLEMDTVEWTLEYSIPFVDFGGR